MIFFRDLGEGNFPTRRPSLVALQKSPSFATGAKSREEAAVRRQAQAKPIRALEMYPSSHNRGQRVADVFA
jgi:hypothetical protein